VTQRADGFSPARDGFAFKNNFTGSPLPSGLRAGTARAVEKGLGLPHEFGLCGGMSLAAADFYLAKRTPPDMTKPPEQGTPLYEYLYQRQRDSMGPMGVMALKFWNWMQLPDHADKGECTQKLTAAELPGIVSRLRARQLVPVGLVLSSQSKGKLWENHQILGYGVREKPGGVVELKVYDPNFPRDDKLVIRLTPVGESAAKDAAPYAREYECERISGKGLVKKVRGVFAMPYEPKTPPKELK
jgi:hypothetical protein